MTRTLVWLLGGMTLVGTLVACGGSTGTGIPGTSSSGGSSSGGSSSGGSSSGGSSSGGSSSSSSSGSTSSSGGLVYTTTCSPPKGDHFFDGAQPASSLGRVAAPCPTGMHGLATSTLLSPTGPLPAPVRFVSADDFAKAYCASGDSGTNGPAVDYASQDVIVVPYRGATSTPPNPFVVGGEVWMKTDENHCEGGDRLVQNQLAFYTVAKGQQLSLETCVTTCGCVGENCEPTPGGGEGAGL